MSQERSWEMDRAKGDLILNTNGNRVGRKTRRIIKYSDRVRRQHCNVQLKFVWYP